MKNLLIIMLAAFTVATVVFGLIGWIPEPETPIQKIVVIASYFTIIGAPTIIGIWQYLKGK